MAIYKYIAKDLQSNKIKGTKEAGGRDELVSLLRQDNLFLVNCQDVTKNTTNTYKMKLNELSHYAREIGTMLGSGLSLIRTFSIMVQREDKAKQKAIYNDIYIKLQQGITLSVAMEMQGKAFPELMVQMFRSGEASGQLEKTAMVMAKQYEKDYKLRNKMKSASIYPMILAVVTVLVVVLVYTAILPNFFEMFENIELPLITKINISISHALTEYWYFFLLGVLGIIAGVTYSLSVPKVRIWVDTKKLKIWKMNKLLKIIYTARFARTLSSLYSSGLSIVNALAIASKTIGNKYLESQFEGVIHDVRNGITLSTAIAKVDGFDPKLVSSIFVGEESGRLEDMLTTLADDYDYDAAQASQKLVAIMEPVMIIIMAVIIAVIMVSVLLPVFTLYQNAGNL